MSPATILRAKLTKASNRAAQAEQRGDHWLAGKLRADAENFRRQLLALYPMRDSNPQPQRTP